MYPPVSAHRCALTRAHPVDPNFCPNFCLDSKLLSF